MFQLVLVRFRIAGKPIAVNSAKLTALECGKTAAPRASRKQLAQLSSMRTRRYHV